jgi:hemoglobin-like flavoprotein
MTPSEIKIVQESFEQLEPSAAEAGKVFYETLFRMAPEVRRLFPVDMAQQEAKLMKMLGWIVANLDDTERIIESAHELGRRHRGYVVNDSHYDKVGQALLMTISDRLGSNLTADQRAAWAAAYSSLAKLMREGAVGDRRGPAEQFM